MRKIVSSAKLMFPLPTTSALLVSNSRVVAVAMPLLMSKRETRQLIGTTLSPLT